MASHGGGGYQPAPGSTTGLWGGAPGRKGGLEADEVVDREERELSAAVAVGVGVSGRESLLETDEIVNGEEGQLGASVAVGVAGAAQDLAADDEGEFLGHGWEGAARGPRVDEVEPVVGRVAKVLAGVGVGRAAGTHDGDGRVEASVLGEVDPVIAGRQ